MKLLGVDTGGTFTDFVLYDGNTLRIHKVLSTPEYPERAILQGIRDLDLNDQSFRLIHGSTVATNALLENKGVRTAYISNCGLEDVLAIGRQARSRLYVLSSPMQIPPVPFEHCIGVDVRVSAGGDEITSLRADAVSELVTQLKSLDVEGVAINLLFSFKNAKHEQTIASALGKNWFVTCSSEVLAEYREYERGIATWINASLGPLMQNYLTRLSEELPNTHVTVMQSTGGTISAEQAGRRAVNLLLSGPAGGLAAARYIGGVSGKEKLLTFDMGGTSTDVALIDKEIQLTTESRVGGYPVAVPMIDMHTIGAGGGSIAYIDEGGLLKVGPESAGADPGPACYGKGGKIATVTDANVLLGRLPGHAALGGELALDKSAARTAILSLAKQANMSCERVAQGIIDVANEHMAQALRVISIERGVDIKDYTLLSFGGAGGMHVCALADALNMRKALVPVYAGVLSAFGMLVAPRNDCYRNPSINCWDHLNSAKVWKTWPWS